MTEVSRIDRFAEPVIGPAFGATRGSQWRSMIQPRIIPF